MKLIHTHEKGTQTFELIDGRHVKSYPSGYVRMSKQIVTGTRMGKPFIDYNNTHYQLNKVERTLVDAFISEYSGELIKQYNHTRILIPCIWDRMEFIKQWELRNCKLTKSEIEYAIAANNVYNSISTNFQVRY
jgi:hypothetical protein